MAEDVKTIRNRIIIAIAFLSKTVTQKNTQDKLGTKFGPIFLGKKYKTSRPKNTKEGIIGKLRKQSLIRGPIKKKWSTHTVEKKSNSKN